MEQDQLNRDALSRIRLVEEHLKRLDEEEISENEREQLRKNAIKNLYDVIIFSSKTNDIRIY
jgi:hypothetical protein